jgi:hypothetical protein
VQGGFYAQRLGELLLTHGWSVTESATYLQVDRSTVTNAVTGRRPIGEKLAAHILASLAQAPHVSARELQELALAWLRDFHQAVLTSAPKSARLALEQAFAPILTAFDSEDSV